MDGYATMREKLMKCEKECGRAIAERNYENTRKLDAVHHACDMRKRLDSATAKLHTLEAAVRAVRGTEGSDWGRRLVELYTLVPEVTT